MNLLYKGVESKNGFQDKILTPLFEEKLIDKCVLVTRSNDILPNNGKNIIEISADYAWNHSLENYLSKNEWLSIPADILENVKKYEAYSLYMTYRTVNFDIYSVFEAEAEYYYFLQFWYTVLVKEEINCFITPYIPHCTWEFVIYSLCKAMNIPTLVLCSTSIPTRFTYGTSFEEIGDAIKTVYAQNNSADVVFQNKNVKDFYYKTKNREANANLSYLGVTSSKKQWKKECQKEVLRFVNYKQLYGFIKHFIKVLLIPSKNNSRSEELNNALYNINLWKRTRAVYKKEKTVDWYDRYAVLPVKGEKFIYFPLHLQPEGTTLPMAGVFYNQVLALQILSEAVKGTDIKIYVKEHFVQTSRPKVFYEKIKKLPNVELIKTCVDSTDLIDNSIAVSSCTGTVLLEGTIRGKCAFAFGKVYNWKGLPGLFLIKDSIQCKELIKGILTGTIKIDPKQVEKYFTCIEKGTVPNYAYAEELQNFDKKEDFSDLINLYRNFIQETITQYGR